MGDSLMKPFVLLITFVGVTIVVLASMNNLQHANAISGAENVATGMEAIAGFNYTMFNPKAGNPITWGNVTTSLNDAWSQFAFMPNALTVHSEFYPDGGSPTGNRAVWIYTIRNNTWDPWITSNIPDPIRNALDTKDMLLVCQKYDKKGWFGVKTGTGWRYAVIPFDVIDSKHEGNISVLPFMLGAENMTAFVITEGEENFTDKLFNQNTFTLGLGQLWGLENVGKQSMWKLVGQLLTCSLPDTNYYVNLLMAISIWAVIAYVAIAMISRFIPTISGL